MNLLPTNSIQKQLQTLRLFVSEVILPAEAQFETELGNNRWCLPELFHDLQQKAKQAGLFNLLVDQGKSPLKQLDYAYLAEPLGASELTTMVLNCTTPDSGNMETLARFGSETQCQEYLLPLLAGEVTSGFAMTEPSVASSDATNLTTTAKLNKGTWVLNGEKTWVAGAGDPRFGFLVLMCVTDETGDAERRHSMLLVPMNSQGIEIIRMLPVFGYDNAPQGYAQIRFTNVRLPSDALIGERGMGFQIAQDRLGNSRIQQCMRSIGAAERALQLMTERATSRFAFGKPLSDLGGNVDIIANSRTEIEMARLLALRAAWALDEQGLEAALSEIAQMKVIVPSTALRVIDRAIQMHGGTGVSADTPLARMWAAHRALRLADGPDEVHRELIARLEIGDANRTYV